LDIKAALSRIKNGIKNIPDNLRQVILDYQESYQKGVEKFGVWWTVFQLSMWGFVAIFLITAILILVVYLPKVETILL
jgi:hypothetical protein